MGKLLRWTEEEINFLKANYDILSTKECSAILNKSIYSIHHKASKLKLSTHYEEWTKEEDDYLLNHYATEDTDVVLEHLSNRSLMLIRNRAYKLGLIRIHKTTKTNLRFLLEETNLNYYIYGFIMSDGHLNDKVLRFTSTVKDLDHFTTLANIFNANIGRIKPNYFTTINGTTKYICAEKLQFSVNDVKYAKKLKEKLNIIGLKTYNPPSLDYIDTKEKFISFITGFIDGDGCITERKSNKNTCHTLSIECHGSWIENFKFFQDKLLKYLYIKSSVSINKNGYCILNISTNNNLALIKQEMLKLNLPFMKRKWDNVESIITPFEYTSILQDNINLIKKEIKNGAKLKSIAEMINVPLKKLQNFCGRNSINRKTLIPDYEIMENNIDYIKNSIIGKIAHKDIAKYLNVTIQRLRDFCYKHNITRSKLSKLSNF